MKNHRMFPFEINFCDKNIKMSRLYSEFSLHAYKIEIWDACNTANWPDVIRNCENCKSVVNNMNTTYITCGSYCSRLGLQCDAAFQNMGDSCTEGIEYSCHDTISTKDAICHCATRNSFNVSFVNKKCSCQKFIYRFLLCSHEFKSCHWEFFGAICISKSLRSENSEFSRLDLT